MTEMIWGDNTTIWEDLGVFPAFLHMHSVSHTHTHTVNSLKTANQQSSKLQFFVYVSFLLFFCTIFTLAPCNNAHLGTVPKIKHHGGRCILTKVTHAPAPFKAPCFIWQHVSLISVLFWTNTLEGVFEASALQPVLRLAEPFPLPDVKQSVWSGDITQVKNVGFCFDVWINV